MTVVVSIVLIGVGSYLLAGLGFALAFVTVGVGRTDPHAAQAGWGFRVLILPGTVFLWPLLARRWLRGERMPPTERTAHRCVARRDSTADRAPHAP